ncbi:hypothetical protein Tco_0994740 [Tanacetum coccineum]
MNILCNSWHAFRVSETRYYSRSQLDFYIIFYLRDLSFAHFAKVPIVPADPIVAPEVGTISVISPTKVLDLVDYSSSSDSDASDDSLPLIQDLPLVLPFLCSDDSKADSESEPAEQRPVSSSHDTLAPSSEFPLAPVVTPPGIHRRSLTLIRLGEAIPFGRPYHIHLNGPRRLLTARKRVTHVPAHHSLSGHTPPDTTDADTSTPPRFVHRSLARTPQRSSSPSSRPSCKRCRSPTTSVPSPTHISRSIAPTPVDLLPPSKRFRDSYSPEDSEEEHIEVDTVDAEAIADVGISDGVVAHTKDSVGMRVEIDASDVREDDEEFETEDSTDISKITRKPLKTGKHEHGKRKSTKEAKNSKPKPRKVNLQSKLDKVVISKALISSPSSEATWKMGKHNGMIGFTLESLTDQTQMPHNGLPCWQSEAWAIRQGLEASSEWYK